MAASLSAVIDQVKFDLISKTQAADNAVKRKEIARTFISRLIYFTSLPKLMTSSADTITGFP